MAEGELIWLALSVYDPAFWENYVSETTSWFRPKTEETRGRVRQPTSVVAAMVTNRLFDDLALSPADMHLLKEYKHPLFKYGSGAKTLGAWIKSWARLVLEIEGAHDYEPDEIIFDMDVRNALQGAVDLSPTLHTRISRVLEPWDQRFLKATRDTDKALSPEKSGWWWYRILL